MENQQIWYRDPKSFFGPENLPYFIPRRSMTYVQQLNAIMRFALYFSLILFFVKRNVLVWYFALFVAFLTIFMYEFYSKNKKMQLELYNKINVMYDEKKDNFCSLPSQDNPFMNPLISEIAEFPNRPEACDINNKKVRKRAEKMFSNNLYVDVDDIWSKKTSSRNWHTVPSAQIPNDRDSFQKYLYQTGPTCKEGSGTQCYMNTYRTYDM